LKGPLLCTITVRNALCSLKIGCAADEPNTAKWSSPSDDVLCLVTAAGLLSVLGSHQQTSVYVCQQQETKCKSQPSTKSCTKLILSALSSCSSLNRADAQHFCPLHYRRSEVIKSGVKTPPSSVKSPPAQQFLLHFINVHTLQAPKGANSFPLQSRTTPLSTTDFTPQQLSNGPAAQQHKSPQ